ncbi:double-strand break repair protein [Malassezia pachydermatis]|uniref:Crossover junction endonuclease eme1 n=1 Tax=Malassezia pachydermatis TaxID=77020 RepID=A0A0M8MRV7_9BASI|nr:crossover junction endonuclease eme1 [Malassezia pachydermatis]KOS15527.1 crossover junction endonuclease eme1 [Malassezia pachydermatis]
MYLWVASAQQVITAIDNDSLQALFVTEMDNTAEARQNILLILGLDAWLKSQRTRENRAYAEEVRQRIQGQSNGSLSVPKDQHRDVERMLLDLELRYCCHIIRVNTHEELSEWIYSIASDVSFRPYRLLQYENSARRTNTHTRNGIPILQAMLEEIPRCTSHASQAIIAKYPSFQALMKGYESCKTPDEASLLLSDLITDGRTQRRIGPQLSKRIYVYLCAHDPVIPIE